MDEDEDVDIDGLAKKAKKQRKMTEDGKGKRKAYVCHYSFIA